VWTLSLKGSYAILFSTYFKSQHIMMMSSKVKAILIESNGSKFLKSAFEF
jgi:hypothetical protein